MLYLIDAQKIDMEDIILGATHNINAGGSFPVIYSGIKLAPERIGL